MKKSLKLIVQLFAMVLPASMYARVITSQEYNGLVYNKGYEYDFQVKNLFYTIHENGVYVSAEKYLYDPENSTEPNEVVINSSYLESIFIPDKVEYGDTVYTVIGIDDAAFKGSDIEDISIPSTVRYIGRYAFSGCANLTDIDLPDGINTIKEMAFSYCSNLYDVELPKCLLYLNYGTFKGCDNLTYVNIPKSVAGLDKEVFSGCGQLRRIYLFSRKPIGFIKGQGENDTFYGVNTDQFSVFVSPGAFHEYAFLSDWASFNVEQNYRLYSQGWYDFIKYSSGAVWIVDALYGGDVIIPQTVNIDGEEYHVEGIESYAFSNNIMKRSVVFPEGLTTIKEFAFSGCNTITSLTFPSTIQEIGESAFRDCDQLTSVYINSKNPNLIYVGDSAFCNSIVCDLYVPDVSFNLYSNSPVWSGFSQIHTNTIIRDNLSFEVLSEEDKTAILVGFNDLHDTLVIPSTISLNGQEYTVVAIKENTFSKCKELISVTIPTSIKTIGAAAFSYCSNLKKINLPPSLSEIEKEVFRECENLDSITFPAKLKKIGDGSFRDCKELQSLYIPDSVETIDGNAFDGCINLKELYVPASVSKIDFTAFQQCSKIESITWNTPYCSLWSVTRECNWSLKRCILGEEIKTLEYNSFCRCRYLSSIILPENLEIIDDNAFEGCLSLTSIVIPQKVQQVNRAAFLECSSLKKVVIEGNPTFYEEAFAWCDNIDTIVFKSQTPPQMCHSVYYYEPYCRDFFSDKTYNDAKLFIPEGSMDAYSTSNIWSRFCSLYTVGYESDFENESIYYTYHTDGVFAGAKALKPDSFRRKFGYDGPLTPRDPATGGLQPRTPRRSQSTPYSGNILIPASVSVNDSILEVTGVNYYAFIGCDEIESVYIPGSVNNLGYGCFAGCSNLKSVNIPSRVSKIPNAIFYDCSSLSSLEIPDSVTVIGYSAFCGCTSLTEITIPAGVKYIDQYAFAYCSGLKRIVIEGNPVIDETAFIGCSAGLEFVYTTKVESHKALDSEGTIHYGIDGRVIKPDTPGLHLIKHKDGTVSKSLVR